jgi:hypothetical protein
LAEKIECRADAVIPTPTELAQYNIKADKRSQLARVLRCDKLQGIYEKAAEYLLDRYAKRQCKAEEWRIYQNLHVPEK